MLRSISCRILTRIKELTAGEIMAAVSATTRAGITARATSEGGELPRTQPSVRVDEVEPSMARVVSIPETLS